MKKQEHLFEAIGQVDDRLVEEAADARRTATPWKKWAALAACLALVIGLGASSLTLLFRGCSSADTSAPAQNATASESTDGAAGAPEADGAETAEDSAETAEDTAAAADAAENGQYEEAGTLPELGPLTAGMEGLTASRAVTITAEDGVLVLRDVYRVTADTALETTLRYPAPTGVLYTVAVDGEEQSVSETEPYIPLTLEPGREAAEVTVTVTLPTGGGIAGFVLPTTGGSLDLTEQTANVDLSGWDGTVLEDDFGSGTVALEPPETYRLALQ